MFQKVLFILFIGFGYSINAQNFVITGGVSDENRKPLTAVQVSLFKLSDTTLYSIAKLDYQRGVFFKFEKVAIGNYVIVVESEGYETINDTINVSQAEGQRFMKFTLRAEAALVGKAVIKLKNYVAMQSDDTSVYRSSSYKTNPDATAEDLVTKMPGVVNTNGKVQAQGEEVKQVLVDGKPFFGEDPGAVLKNIPADMVDKVQVFDQKSAQTQFTGFDDGNTTKTINIITKKQYRNGVFGKAYTGAGLNQQYRAGASVNFFKDNRKFSFLLNSNNINEQNFSDDDLLGVLSSQGGKKPHWRPNPDENFLVGNKNGIAKTNALGLNYSNIWGNVNFAASYFFNSSNTNSLSNTLRTYITTQSQGLFYNENASSEMQNTNHRFNLKLDWKIDSTSSLLFQPKFSFQNNNNNQLLNGINTQSSKEISGLKSDYISLMDGYNLNANILYRKRFSKSKSTLSVNVTPTYNKNSGYNRTLSYNTYLDTADNDTLNQRINNKNDGLSTRNNITYTVPMSKVSQLSLSFSNNLIINTMDKKNNKFSNSDGQYNLLDSNLSNIFKSNYMANAAGVGYSYNKSKIRMNFSVDFQKASLSVERQFPMPYDTVRNFYSVLPRGMFMYNFSKNRNIRLFYRSYNNAPTIDQLQDIINNSNPLQLSSGNKNLKQDFRNFVGLTYRSTNTRKNTSYFGMIMATVTRNYIANNTFIFNSDSFLNSNLFVSKGTQIITPDNLSGYYSLRASQNYSFGMNIGKFKSNVNIDLSASTTRTPSTINNVKNYSTSNNYGAGATLSSNISKDVDFTLSTNTSYNTVDNTLQKQLNTTYLNQISRAKFQIMPWKGLVLQSEITHQINSGLSQAINTNFILLNAGLGYKFLKDRSAEIRLIGFDLLKQNTNISRNTTETYYEDIKNNILQRYFMLNFTYTIKYFKNDKAK